MSSTTTGSEGEDSISSPSVIVVDVTPAGVPETQPFSIINFLKNLFENYKILLKQAPLYTKSITSCTIAILGEILGSYIKCRINGEKFRVNPKRVGVFGLYGLLVTGPVLHWWYGLLETVMKKMNVVGYSKSFYKLLFDRLLFGPPFVLYTICFLQLLQTNSVQKTIEYVKMSYYSILMMNEKIWTIAQAVNFELIPVEYQVLFVNAVSIGWNTYLSITN